MKYLALAFSIFAFVLVTSAPVSAQASTRTERASWVAAAKAERKAKKYGRKPVAAFVVPVLGIDVDSLEDTWGHARSHGRTHEGVDIIAPRGSVVVSPTKAVVIRIGKDTLGGTVVYTANAGGERFYYAHLDRVAKGLKVGQELTIGDVIGYVGNTGNASSTVPHLHLGIYGKKGATNPFPRITKELSPEVQKKILASELMKKKTELAKKK
jgi:murein DD-endopeptidase MepM/ murein hydrolase activator NlpD